MAELKAERANVGGKRLRRSVLCKDQSVFTELRSSKGVVLGGVWRRGNEVVRSLRTTRVVVERCNRDGSLADRIGIAKSALRVHGRLVLTVSVSISWRGVAYLRVVDDMERDLRVRFQPLAGGTFAETASISHRGVLQARSLSHRRPTDRQRIALAGANPLLERLDDFDSLFGEFSFEDLPKHYDVSTGRKVAATLGRAAAWAAGAVVVTALAGAATAAIVAAGAAAAASSIISDSFTYWENSGSNDPAPGPTDMGPPPEDMHTPWEPFPPDMGAEQPPPQTPAPPDEPNFSDPDNMSEDPRNSSQPDDQIGMNDTGVPPGGGAGERDPFAIVMTDSIEGTGGDRDDDDV
jgi:hypothetical protein